MTSVIVPDFVCKLFEDEVREIMVKCITSLSTKLDIPLKTLQYALDEETRAFIQLVPEEIEGIKITKVRRRRVLEPEQKCAALVKKTGIIRQCTFSHNATSCYCTRHEKKAITNPNFNDDLAKERDDPTVLAEKKKHGVRRVY